MSRLGPPTPPDPGTLVELAPGTYVNAFDEGAGLPVVLVHQDPKD